MTKTLRVVGCFIEHDGKILSLLRHRSKSAGGTWALPAGKVDAGEDDVQAMVRELREETGYVINPDNLIFIGTQSYTFGPELTIVFPTFKAHVNSIFDIRLKTDEHEAYQWILPQELHALPNLVINFGDLIEAAGYVPRKEHWTSTWEPASRPN